MDEFTTQISARIATARAAAAAAKLAGDDFLASVHEGELDSLTLLASSNGVTIDLTELEQRESA